MQNWLQPVAFLVSLAPASHPWLRNRRDQTPPRKKSRLGARVPQNRLSINSVNTLGFCALECRDCALMFPAYGRADGHKSFCWAWYVALADTSTLGVRLGT